MNYDELFNTRTALAFKAGMSESEFVFAFIEALPERSRAKWKNTEKATTFAASCFVRDQLSERFKELTIINSSL